MNRPVRDNIYRASFPATEFREADGESVAPTLSGHFAVFSQPTEISSAWEGNFIESIAPGSFRKTFAENRDQIKLLFQHGRDPQIGDRPIADIVTLREDDKGAYYEATVFDGLDPLVMSGLRAGAYGASFRFKVMREDLKEKPGVSAANPRGIPERVIREAQVMELGPVTWGAYAGATAGVRSITDELRDVDALAYAGAVMLDDERFNRARIFVTRGIQTPDDVTPDDDATPIPTGTDEVVRLRERKDALTRAMDDAEPAALLDGDTVEALGSLIEVCESALEAMESLLGIDDDTTPDEDDSMGETNSADAEGTIRTDAPPVDDAEPVKGTPRPWTPREDNPPPEWWRSRDDEEVPSAWR